jgi:hypothetical protein
MKTIFISILLVCVSVFTEAQTNFVKNGDFERYDTCPYQDAQITFAKFWQNTVVPDFERGVGYYNACAIGNIYAGCPINGAFYQNPRSGNGMSGSTFYYDKTLPPLPPPSPFNNRLYIQGHLIKKLINGKKYCISFWVNLMEGSGYAQNKIAAYLDDGSINKAVDSAGEEITSVIPQVYTDSIIRDTMNWVKIEGSFTATGNENYITIGNFATNAATDTLVTNYRYLYQQQSVYLVDDVSVVSVDEIANAGVDRWVELGKQTQIGPVEDSTARGMDCQWYYKGKWIGNGNVITVSASTIKYAVDTYVVVQNVCGKTTRDTMLLRTVGAGMSSFATTETRHCEEERRSNLNHLVSKSTTYLVV